MSLPAIKQPGGLVIDRRPSNLFRHVKKQGEVAGRTKTSISMAAAILSPEFSSFGKIE